MKIDSEIDDYFTQYAKAFSESDIEGIIELWAFPAFISADQGSVIFTDAEAFRPNTAKLLEFYVRQGMQQARKTVLNIELLFSGLAQVRTRYELHNKQGELINQWEHVYILRQSAERWRAISAFADNEVASWEAVGTPLGSS